MNRALPFHTICAASIALYASCGGDDSTTPPATDAGRRDGAVASDAGGVDANPGVDGGTVTDATPADAPGACDMCIGETLEWGMIGGRVAYVDTSSIAACREYALRRTDRGSPGMSCTNQVPCEGDAVTIADVLAALADSDVVAAFAAAPVTYGRDTRPVDGQILSVTQAGKTFLVGEPCGGTSGCLAIPPGVQALADTLRTLDAERLLEETCASIFPM